MRLDEVEIKISFSPGATERSIEELDLPRQTDGWKIYFCEDVNPGAPGTPLLDLGVVLRARVRPGADDDMTVKLRPCRGSQLIERWVAETVELKVEADWAGGRQVLAASLTRQRPESLVKEVVARQRPVQDLFTGSQREFLTECVAGGINLEALTVLPPITAVRWRSVSVAPPELGLRAERWAVDDLDFLELSAVAPIDQAPAKQAAMLQFVRSRGLVVPDEQEPKTRLIMEHLVHNSLGSP